MASQQEVPELLTIPQVARRLRVTRRRVYVWIKEGRLKTVSVVRHGREAQRVRIEDCKHPNPAKSPKGKLLGRRPKPRTSPLPLTLSHASLVRLPRNGRGSNASADRRSGG